MFQHTRSGQGRCADHQDISPLNRFIEIQRELVYDAQLHSTLQGLLAVSIANETPAESTLAQRPCQRPANEAQPYNNQIVRNVGNGGAIATPGGMTPGASA